jgi:hypothetical protein
MAGFDFIGVETSGSAEECMFISKSKLYCPLLTVNSLVTPAHMTAVNLI